MDLLAEYRCAINVGSIPRSTLAAAETGSGPHAHRAWCSARHPRQLLHARRGACQPLHNLAPTQHADYCCIAITITSDGGPGSPGGSGESGGGGVGGGKVTLLSKEVSTAPAVDTAGLALVDNRAVASASTRMLLCESSTEGVQCACSALDVEVSAAAALHLEQHRSNMQCHGNRKGTRATCSRFKD